MSSELLRKYIDLFEQDQPFKVDVSGVLGRAYAVFIGDSIAYGLSSRMMTNTLRDTAVGLTSSAISNRVARNEDVKWARWAVVSAGTNDFATGQGNAGALESNLDSIRSALKAEKYVWLGPYNEQANAVVKKYAASKGDTFIDLRRFPADSLGIHPQSYSSLLTAIMQKTTLGPDDRENGELVYPKLGFPYSGVLPANSGPSPSASSNDKASTNTPPADVEKTGPPKDISQYKDKVKKLKIDFQTKFDRSLPITSEERTRAKQQSLYDRWLKKEPGIYIPINPAKHPGREIFHNTAIDVSPALTPEEEAWMKEQGWVRTMPVEDPPHYEYQGKWDEAPPPAPAPNKEKDNAVKQSDLDKLGIILRKKIKEDSVNQLTPQEQMRVWQAVIAEADAPRIEPTWDKLRSMYDDNWGSGNPDIPALPAASQPKIKIVKDGAGVAIVGPNGVRIPDFANPKEAMAWMEKDPANYKMVMGNAPTNWIGGKPPNLKPLGFGDKLKQGFGKGAAALALASALGAAGNYAYNKFRTPDLSNYSLEDQATIKEMLPLIKGYYNDVDKFQSELNRNQQLQVIDYVNTLKKLPALKADFPPNSKWDDYIKTIK